MIMWKVFYAYRCSEKGSNDGVIGIFLEESDAKKAIIGQGFWGGDGNYLPLDLYSSFEEYEGIKRKKEDKESEEKKFLFKTLWEIMTPEERNNWSNEYKF